MKKQIKFRGKRTDTGEWIYGDLLTSDGTECEISDWNDVVYSRYDVDSETVGQLIGVIPNTSMYVDNSQELYEDDLFTCGKSKTVYRAVHDGCGEYCGVSNEGDKYGAYTIRLSRDNVSRRDIKIVGNIHDNPKLPKGGEEQRN